MRRLLSVVLILVLAQIAYAINFTAPLTDLDDKPIVAGPEGKEEPLTLGKVASIALVMSFQDEATLAGDEKVKRFSLALKVRSTEELALTAEEITLVKKCIAKAYGAVIVGRAWALLDPASVKP